MTISVHTENERTVTGMAEYIDREAAIESIMSEPPDAHYPHWYADKIKAIPAADVATVRHGRWLSWDELHGGNTRAKNVLGVFCSECIRQSDSKTHFCPNCGAMMGGGSDG